MSDTFFSLWKGHGRRPTQTMADIIADVASYWGLQASDLTGTSRLRNIAQARQQAMAEIYATGRFSTTQVGLALGGRDHSTILHGIRVHKARLIAQDGETIAA